MITVAYRLLPQRACSGAGARPLHLEVILRIAQLKDDTCQGFKVGEDLFSTEELTHYCFVQGSDGYKLAHRSIQRLGKRHGLDTEESGYTHKITERFYSSIWKRAMKASDWTWARYFMEIELRPLWEGAKAAKRDSTFYFCAETRTLLEVHQDQVIFKKAVQPPSAELQWAPLQPEPTPVTGVRFPHAPPAPFTKTPPLPQKTTNQTKPLPQDQPLPPWIYTLHQTITKAPKYLRTLPALAVVGLLIFVWFSTESRSRNLEDLSNLDDIILSPDNKPYGGFSHFDLPLEQIPSLQEIKENYTPVIYSNEWVAHPGIPSPLFIYNVPR